MIKIIRGYYSSNLYGKGKVLELSEAKEKALVDAGFAEYMKEAPEEGKADSAYMQKEQLLKMKKIELIEYAKSIDLDVNENMKITEIQNVIFNYQEEKEDK